MTNNAIRKTAGKGSRTAGTSVSTVLLKCLLYLIPGIYAVTCIFPVVWLAYTSFKTQTEFSANILGLPNRMYLGNWEYTLQNLNITHYLFNTARITAHVLDNCQLSCTIPACHLLDNCQLCCVIPACSAA